MTVFERAQLAAVFLAKWVDAAEEPGPRIVTRAKKALAMADVLIVEGELQEREQQTKPVAPRDSFVFRGQPRPPYIVTPGHEADECGGCGKLPCQHWNEIGEALP